MDLFSFFKLVHRHAQVPHYCGSVDTNTYTTISCKISLLHFQCGLYDVIKAQLFGEPILKNSFCYSTMPRVI